MAAKVSLKHYWTALIVSLSLLAAAYFYFQQHLGMYPCPLCMLQRACLVGVAVIALLGILKRPSVVLHRFYAFLILICTSAGIFVAGRHVWLQSLPADEVPECGFDPIYRMGNDDSYGLLDMIATTLKGSGDCAEVDYFLGVSIAMWMLIIFVVMSLVTLWSLIKPTKKFAQY